MNLLITVKDKDRTEDKARELRELGFEVMGVLPMFGTISVRGDPGKLIFMRDIRFRLNKKLRAT